MKRATRRSGRATKRVALEEQLDQAVENIMSDRESTPPAANSRIAAIVRLASELRDLPKEDFKMQLKKDLLVTATPASSSLQPSREKPSYIPTGYHTANAC